MIKESCNVLIVGAGPAGLFAAHELAKRGVTGIRIVDAGKETPERHCPLTTACNCSPCDILEGVGGSGGVSDGKMPFSLDRGTQLEKIFRPEHAPLLDYVDRTMVGLGLKGVRYLPEDSTPPPGFGPGSPLEFETYPLWHIGSDGIRLFSERFAEVVRGVGVRIDSGVRVEHVRVDQEGPRISGVVARRRGSNRLYEEVQIDAEHVVLAVGLWGIGFLEEELALAGVRFGTGPAGIGLRVETPNQVLAPLFDAFYDWKAQGTFEGYHLRSFCCNRDGYIVPEFHKHVGIRNVNGHSYLDPERRSKSSNFSLQAKVTTEDHPDPQGFVRALARKMNGLSGGWQVRQTVREFVGLVPHGSVDPDGPEASHVTYPAARYRDLRAAFPPRLLKAFTDYMIALDKAIPGTIDSGWVYGPEVKYHARKLPIETEGWTLEGMVRTHAIGDSTGLTGSYVSAALTGIIAAQHIAR